MSYIKSLGASQYQIQSARNAVVRAQERYDRAERVLADMDRRFKGGEDLPDPDAIDLEGLIIALEKFNDHLIDELRQEQEHLFSLTGYEE